MNDQKYDYRAASYQVLETGANGKAVIRDITVEPPYGQPYNGIADNNDLKQNFEALGSGKQGEVQVPVTLNPYNGKSGLVIYFKAPIK